MTFHNNAPTKTELKEYKDYKELERYVNGTKVKFANGKEWYGYFKWVDKGNDCGYYVYIESTKFNSRYDEQDLYF
jgi:hypothetical protein